MSPQIKKIAAIHDLSGFGRCSLSVIIPVISSMGIQVVPVPTTILSTHMGGFGNNVTNDLTDYIPKALLHYKTIPVLFDCVYTGFLGSNEQIAHCIDFLESYQDSFKIVDPVMGDNGKIYKTYTKDMCDSICNLVRHADLITPNKTEMYILLNEEWNNNPVPIEKSKQYLLELSKLGPSKVIITGIELDDMTINNIGYDKKNDKFWRVVCKYVPQNYPGTGDIFASVVISSILNGANLPVSIETATKFLELTIKTTYDLKSNPMEGIMIEKTLPWLFKTHNLTRYQSF